MKYGVLIDLTKCIGCRSCQVACKRWNERPGEKTTLSPEWTNPLSLSENTWTAVRFVGRGKGDAFRWHFVKWQCMHCENPPCVSVCPTGAAYKRPDGIVHIDYDKCFGCKYCIVACPYHARHYDHEEKTVLKCTMCFDRIEGGRKPACVQACTTEALDFGARDEIVRKARLRAKAIGGYVYGDESEDVATSTIYVSDVPFEELGFPTLEQRTPTPKAFRNLLPTRLAEASFGAIVMAVLGFVIWRRWTIAKAKLEAVPGKVKKEE